jgi:hypothetical protein
MGYYISETFFRPTELSRQETTLPAKLFNSCRLLLARSSAHCVFVPIRSMQFQGVIERGEIIFVDSQGGYAVKNGVGGRPIVVAWQFPLQSRDSICRPMAMQVVGYRHDSEAVHRRLIGEFAQAVEMLKHRLHGSDSIGMRTARIISLTG